MSDEDLVAIYRAAGEIEALLIKGLLEDNGIPCLLKSNAASSVHVFTVDGLGEVKVMVPRSMEQKARDLVEGSGHVQMAG